MKRIRISQSEGHIQLLFETFAQAASGFGVENQLPLGFRTSGARKGSDRMCRRPPIGRVRPPPVQETAAVRDHACASCCHHHPTTDSCCHLSPFPSSARRLSATLHERETYPFEPPGPVEATVSAPDSVENLTDEHRSIHSEPYPFSSCGSGVAHQRVDLELDQLVTALNNL